MKLSRWIALALLTSTTSAIAQTDLTWPAGENVCAGRWTYTQLASCAYADDPKSPIYGTTLDVSFDNKTCQNWDSWHVAETITKSMEWQDSIVAPSPATLQPKPAHDKEQWVVVGTKIEGPWNGSCKSRNIFKKCTSHHKVNRITFTFDRRVANTTKSAACGQARIETPRTIVTGYNKLVGFSASCPGATRPQSSYLVNKTTLQGPGIDLTNLACSTLDGTAVTDDASIQNKFDAYLALAFELAAQPEQCDRKKSIGEALNTFANATGSSGATALTEDQLNLVFPTIDSLNADCN